jgi:hypothetical protein
MKSSSGAALKGNDSGDASVCGGDASTTGGASTDPPSFEPKALAADGFLPVLIYALVHASIEHPLVTKYLLSALCDSEKRMSETGYFLCSLEAALTHLEQI